MHQHINGNGNFQAGGDIVLGPKFSPDNPNAVKCPQCWQITGRLSDHCHNCRFGVKAHFDALDRKARAFQLNKVGSITGLVGFALFYANQYIEAFSFELGLAGTLSIGAALLCFSASGKLEG